MDREAIMAKVKEKVEGLPGIVGFRYLNDEDREDIIRLEKEAEMHGAIGGMMPFTNKGVWGCFGRDVQFVIVGSKQAELLGLSEALVYIEDKEGQRIGEWVRPERREELRCRSDVCFLGDDFCLYQDVDISGEPYFVLSPVDFPYLDDVEGVENVTSGSVSTLADDYIRYRMGYSETKNWTHLVGFDFKEE
jgi:hypothetical protein